MKKLFLLTVLLISAFSLYAQRETIEMDFLHSMRMSHKNINVRLENHQNERFELHIKSYPVIDSTSWDVSTYTKEMDITENQFTEIKALILNLNYQKLLQEFDFSGTDGTIYILKYENMSNAIAVKFWSPFYSTEQRNLEEFTEVCDKIIELAGIRDLIYD